LPANFDQQTVSQGKIGRPQPTPFNIPEDDSSFRYVVTFTKLRMNILALETDFEPTDANADFGQGNS